MLLLVSPVRLYQKSRVVLALLASLGTLIDRTVFLELCTAYTSGLACPVLHALLAKGMSIQKGLSHYQVYNRKNNRITVRCLGLSAGIFWCTIEHCLAGCCAHKVRTMFVQWPKSSYNIVRTLVGHCTNIVRTFFAIVRTLFEHCKNIVRTLYQHCAMSDAHSMLQLKQIGRDTQKTLAL